MKFYTWSNNENDERLARLIKSARINNITVEIIGHGRDINEDGKLCGKNIWLYEKLQELNENEIIMCTDAFDVIYLASEGEILKKFKSLNTRILFGAETHLAGLRYNSTDHKKIMKLAKNETYKYLNSGVVIGYVSDLKKMYKNLIYDVKNIPKWKWSNDQGYVSKRYANKKEPIKLDFKKELIWTDIFYDKPNWPVSDKKWELHVKELKVKMTDNYLPNNFKNGRLRNEKTNTFPCILHVPTNKHMSSVTDLIFEHIYG